MTYFSIFEFHNLTCGDQREQLLGSFRATFGSIVVYMVHTLHIWSSSDRSHAGLLAVAEFVHARLSQFYA